MNIITKYDKLTKQDKELHLRSLEKQGREAILKHIKAQLRGRNNTWHMIDFYYLGVYVATKNFGIHTNDLKSARYCKKEECYKPFMRTSAPYRIETQKDALQWFDRYVLGQIDYQLGQTEEN